MQGTSVAGTPCLLDRAAQIALKIALIFLNQTYDKLHRALNAFKTAEIMRHACKLCCASD
jgi:hypothetical protein